MWCVEKETWMTFGSSQLGFHVKNLLQSYVKVSTAMIKDMTKVNLGRKADLSYTIQEHLLRSSTSYNGLGPLISISNHENVPIDQTDGDNSSTEIPSSYNFRANSRLSIWNPPHLYTPQSNSSKGMVFKSNQFTRAKFSWVGSCPLLLANKNTLKRCLWTGKLEGTKLPPKKNVRILLPTTSEI